jgi:hypothetical protein
MVQLKRFPTPLFLLKSYISRVRRSLKDVKAGRVRRVTAQTLIDELGLDA